MTQSLEAPSSAPVNESVVENAPKDTTGMPVGPERNVAWSAVEGYIDSEHGSDVYTGELDRPRTAEEMIDMASTPQEAVALCFQLVDVNPAVNLERIARVSHRFPPENLSDQDRYTLTFMTQLMTNQLMHKETVDIQDPFALAAGHDALVELQGETANTGPILTALATKAEELKEDKDKTGTNDEVAEVISDAIHVYQDADRADATLLQFIQKKVRSVRTPLKPSAADEQQQPVVSEEQTPVVAETHQAWSAENEQPEQDPNATGFVGKAVMHELVKAS